MVYEIFNAEGDVYRIQSYSQTVAPSLTIEDLESLGERLQLPDGWSFHAHVLEEDSYLISDGGISIITDEFDKTYQKIVDAE